MELLGATLQRVLHSIRNASSQSNTPRAALPIREANCSRCQDRGIYIVEGKGVICPCRKERSLLTNVLLARSSSNLEKCSFENFSFRYYSRERGGPEFGSSTHYDIACKAMAAGQQFVRDYLDSKRARGLMFCGPVGSGKTFLVRAIANALLEKGYQVLFTVVPDLLDDIRATYDCRSEGSYSEQELMETAKNVEVLILDDLGAFAYTEWARNKLFSIVNHRLFYQLPVIVTTNLELEELEDYIGERTTSRLVELCAVYRLLVDRDIRYVINLEKKSI